LYSIDVIDKYVQLDEYLSKSDIVFTGEGRIDDRTATGKLPCGLALKAKKYNLPVVAIVGGISSDCEDIFYNGIDAVESICEGPCSLEDSINNAYPLIKRAAERVTRFMFRIPKRASHDD
jgi:glycerate 2-kinase